MDEFVHEQMLMDNVFLANKYRSLFTKKKRIDDK